jgi:LysM repeat protein
MIMSQHDNYVNPDYNEGAPHSDGTIMSSYVVEEADTLPDIARKFNLSVDELLAANKDHIADATGLIQPGTRIMIPKIQD